jgi:hypothetical protein
VSAVDVEVFDQPEGDLLARGSYYGGPDYEFVAWSDGQVYFRVVGDGDLVWAGRDTESFCRIVEAWGRYRTEVRELTSEAAQLERVYRMKKELSHLGAFPVDLSPDPESLWSLLAFEAENGLG